MRYNDKKIAAIYQTCGMVSAPIAPLRVARLLMRAGAIVYRVCCVIQ